MRMTIIFAKTMPLMKWWKRRRVAMHHRLLLGDCVVSGAGGEGATVESRLLLFADVFPYDAGRNQDRVV
jgi:hypothetical protein